MAAPYFQMRLADNLTSDGIEEIYVSDGLGRGSSSGIGVLQFQPETGIRRVKSFQLGVGRWQAAFGVPQFNSIERIVFKNRTLTAPQFVSQPLSRTNDAGTVAVFSVGLSSQGSFKFRWFRNEIALSDSDLITGTSTSTLGVKNVLKVDEGDYRVEVESPYGKILSEPARLTVNEPVIIQQPVSTLREPGQDVSFSVKAAGSDLSYTWLKDNLVLSGKTNSTLSITNIQSTDRSTYQVVVANSYGSVTSLVAVLRVNFATLDTDFNPPPMRGFVRSLALQPDERILVGGNVYDAVSGQLRSPLRLESDGGIDDSFSPAINSDVYALSLQTNGSVLTTGYFFGRLGPDGSMQNDWSVHEGNGSWTVFSVTVQEDGKILAGGPFPSLLGHPRPYLGRLNAGGTVDTEFNPDIDSHSFSIAVQPDGKILVGAYFGNLNRMLGRLNADGTIDTDFSPPVTGEVRSLALQPDGRILVGGDNFIIRINNDGSMDETFNGSAAGRVNAIALQTDGKILVGGQFNSLCGQPRQNLGRLAADGALDIEFCPEPNAEVLAVALESDGEIVVGGVFSGISGQSRNGIARLKNTEPASQNLNSTGSTVEWARGGTSPEVWRVTFEYSTNGSIWIPLGVGSRIDEGWKLDGAVRPESSFVRARGHLTGGSGIIEFVRQL